MYYQDMQSPVGPLRLLATEQGVRAVLWGPDDARFDYDEPLSDDEHVLLQKLERHLGSYFRGERPIFDLPTDLEGTDFQKAVWEELKNIPHGTTISYKLLAERIGRPSAVRAVANAVGDNPISIAIPCHRVIGSDGSLTGFAGGLEAKTWLLKHEGVL